MATEAKVLERRLYIAVDPSGNHNKFWQYERLDQVVSEEGKKGVMETGDIRYTWGRVGSKGDSTLKMFSEKDLASIIRSKTNRKPPEPSYTEVTTVGGGAGVASTKSMAKEEVKRLAVAEIGGSCPITSALIRKLAEANRHELLAMSGGELDVDLETGIVRTALGVVTLAAVKDARKKLDLMAPYVKSGNTGNTNYADLLGEYLRLVPQKVPGKRGWHTDWLQLDKQTQLLDQLESSIEIANQRTTDAINTAPGREENRHPLQHHGRGCGR